MYLRCISNVGYHARVGRALLEETTLTMQLREFCRGNVRISTALEAVAGAERLTISFSNYRDAETCPPIFHRWPTINMGHRLRISDPTFFMDEKIRLCSCLGTENDDPIPAIVDVCRGIADELGIEPDRKVFIGSSGAGFAALQCAILDGVSVGIANNPSIELKAYEGYDFVADTARIFRPNSEYVSLCREYPLRFSVISALKKACDEGKRPRLGIMQNRSDTAHFHSHYGEFCRALGIPPSGGCDPSGRYFAMTFDHPFGHGAVLPDSDLEKFVDQVCG